MSMKRGRNQQVAAAATPGEAIAVPATAETNGGNRAGKPVGSQLNRPRAACQSGLSKSWEGRLSSVKGKCCAGADRPQKAMKIKFVTRRAGEPGLIATAGLERGAAGAVERIAERQAPVGQCLSHAGARSVRLTSKAI